MSREKAREGNLRVWADAGASRRRKDRDAGRSLCKRLVTLGALVAWGACWAGDYPFRPAEMTNVTVTAGFWLPRFETNRLVTVWADFRKSEDARIPNFRNAAARNWGTFRGIPFDDSDVYKIIEGAAYTLSTHPDPKLEKYLDDLIDLIAKAQEPDGYLYTSRTLGFTYGQKDGKTDYGMMGPTRWSNCHFSHELYNVGHMYEAAVAYHEVTGKRTLLDVAIRSADLIDRTFGPGPTQLKAVPGHEEIELALCKLYRATGEARYLELAKHFLDRRGAANGGTRAANVFSQEGDLVAGGEKEMRLSGAYNQNHLPVTRQREAVGHAVRAGYLYCGMVDVAALTGNGAYVKAIDALWANVVGKKLHLSGGIGARPDGEAFGANYELPNDGAYLETCASIANALWNQRMFLMRGDAKYVDVLERVLYNGFLSGVSLGGDEFFYENPLASRGGYSRSKWFGCSCCPVNIVRFIPQIAQFAYATRGDAAYVNLFVASEARLNLAGGDVKLAQRTAYPWSGMSAVTVTPSRDGQRFALHVRIPGWCVGRPVPSDLYEQVVPGTLADFSVAVNGAAVKAEPRKGYCVLDRAWKRGDVVTIGMNMPVRRIKAHDAVAADRDRLAVERGPILYCAEGVDNGGRALDKAVAPDAVFTETVVDVLGNAYPALTCPARTVTRGLRSCVSTPTTLTLIPYFAWCHRGAGEMQVFFPVKADPALVPASFEAKASHCCETDTTDALCDGIEPKGSGDRKLRRLTFWPHRGSEEWVSYELPEAEEVSGAEVYWFDDTGVGACRVPASWKVQVKASSEAPWRDVTTERPGVANRFNGVSFAPARAKAVRLVVKLRKDFSGGVLKWNLK